MCSGSNVTLSSRVVGEGEVIGSNPLGMFATYWLQRKYMLEPLLLDTMFDKAWMLLLFLFPIYVLVLGKEKKSMQEVIEHSL